MTRRSSLHVTPLCFRYGFESILWDDSRYFVGNRNVETFVNGAQSEGWIAFGKIGFAHWVNFGRYEGRSDGQ